MLARVTTDPGDLKLPDHLDLCGGTTGQETGWRWLTHVWKRPDLRAAIGLASPALAEQLDAVLDLNEVNADRVDPPRLRRLLLATVSYLLRWQGRPTPFGLFAGVMAVRTGRAAATFGTAHRLRLRADGRWLGGLIDRLERHPALLPRLSLIVNSSGVVRGDRFVIPGKPTSGISPGPLVEVSVRHTRPVRAALAAATQPIQFEELAAQLSATSPTTRPETINTLLAGLVEQGVLLTNLRPPSTVVDTVGYLEAQLRAAGCDEIPDIVPLLADLTEIGRELSRHNTCASTANTDPLREGVAGRMRTLHKGIDQVLAADTVVDGTISIPAAVIDEAAAAASALVRLSAQPFGTEAWKDFHVRFRDRYGPGALVPVRDLIADSGLGLPAGFLGAPRGRAARAMTDRDAELLSLIQQAAVDGRQEIELTKPMISSLARGNPEELIAPRRVELAFMVHADSPEGLDRGRFQLWVNGAPRSNSSMAGRFADLLPGPDRDRLAASYETADPDTEAAQLSFPPRRIHNDNVVRVPQLLPAVICLGEYAALGTGTDRIGLDDLAVIADATQMYLVQVSTGHRIVPCVLHALEASAHTPPLARFLAEVSSARHAVYGPFDFGVARTLPHLPRVRYGRTVLAPARWVLSTTDLPSARETMQTWEKAVSAWRDRWHVPPHIVLVQGDLRLPLDLEQPVHRTVLRTRLDRAEQLELREVPDPASHGWMGQACEFLVPFTAAPAPARPVRTVHVARPHPVLLPGGSEVIHARLLGHPARYEEILTDHLSKFLATLDLVRWWWFRRHRDTTHPDSDQYLWLYLRLTSRHAYGPAAARLADFAADLQSRGLLAELVLAAYQPHTGRYGPDIEAAEQVATADTRAALAQITMATQSNLPRQAITAASMTTLAADLAPDPRTGYRWLVDQLSRDSGKLDRTLRETTLLLAGPSPGHQTLRSHPGGEQVAAAWRARRATLAAYRDQLAAVRDPATVLRTLLHDQHVRGIGVDPEGERVTNRLARTAALRRLALADRPIP